MAENGKGGAYGAEGPAREAARPEAGRRAFTLVELLVIVAIVCAMAGVGVVSVRGGQAAARVKGATRDVFAAIRQARSQALVSQQPVVVTYSTEESDGEPMAKVAVTGAKLFSSGVDRAKVRTVTGEPLKEARVSASDAAAARAAARAQAQEARTRRRTADAAVEAEPAAAEAAGDGSLVEDVLFAPIKDEVVRGMRLKVVMDGDEAAAGAAGVRKSRVSVFSNVDYLLGKFQEAGKKTTEAASGAESGAAGAKGVERQEPVSVVWETNGRVDPHRVFVYADGQRPEDGLSIRIDRFGAAKVLSGDGRDEEDD